MYPILRFVNEMRLARKQPKLAPDGTHVSTHRCWPWDIDPWIELNNGRTLTLYDLGRLPMAMRNGAIKIMRENRWSIAVAGVSVRYRRRIKAFQRFTMITRTLGWDDRFIYMEQSIWSRGECANNMLLRGAITSDKGIVTPAHFMVAGGEDPVSPPLPAWVLAWIEADGLRPWPPVVPPLAMDDPRDDLPR